MIEYIGVNDHKVDLFEGQYKVKNGMSYNSYMIKDRKIAIMDTVDAHFKAEWLNNISLSLNGQTPDYLVVLHMEPDHSANISALVEVYPDITIVGNAKTFAMIGQFFSDLSLKNTFVIKEGDVLDLGNHQLKFIFAPMVHWPEVMMAYDLTTKTLFSADAFGKFGALDKEEEWLDEARRYYIGIVGKYGAAVQALFKKAASLDVQQIYPLHGPILQKNLSYYLNLYQTWSNYQAEQDGVCIAYASIYGNTKQAIEELCKSLDGTVYEVFDLTRCDMAEAISKAFQYSKLVIASPTYNNGVFPSVETFLHGLVERNYQNRTIGVIENGTWAPTAKKYIIDYFSGCKNVHFLEKSVTIKSVLSAESREQLQQFAEELHSTSL